MTRGGAMNGRPRAFRLLDTGARDAFFNMGLDEAILMQVGAGESPPTVRFYGWERPTVSIGYFQRARRDVDMGEIARSGYRLVRRMTGGRAVLHDRELTYSVAVPAGHPLAASSVAESYRALSLALQEGFRALGLEAKIVSPAGPDERAEFRPSGSAACFDSPSRYELAVNGRKIAGSAQVRAHGGMLQHGSLVLDLDAGGLFSVLLFRSPEERARALLAFAERAAGVRQLGGRDVSYREAAGAFAAGFAAGLRTDLRMSAPTPAEVRLASELAVEKYAADEWTHRR